MRGKHGKQDTCIPNTERKLFLLTGHEAWGLHWQIWMEDLQTGTQQTLNSRKPSPSAVPSRSNISIDEDIPSIPSPAPG
ncbi:hypothetical protein V491_08970 [Pseudogymnoascus sp. VKM F-3775]|nr:hypothetical protein V491_08970 [Pseudogymnoascus sp. VKM F-3775]